MAQTFTLTAIPSLLREGDQQGHLEYVTFIAEDGDAQHKWSVTNNGTFAEDFAKIVPPDTVLDILTRLQRGETVQFPCFLTLAQVMRPFGGSSNRVIPRL